MQIKAALLSKLWTNAVCSTWVCVLQVASLSAIYSLHPQVYPDILVVSDWLIKSVPALWHGTRQLNRCVLSSLGHRGWGNSMVSVIDSARIVPSGYAFGICCSSWLSLTVYVTVTLCVIKPWKYLYLSPTSNLLRTGSYQPLYPDRKALLSKYKCVCLFPIITNRCVLVK